MKIECFYQGNIEVPNDFECDYCDECEFCIEEEENDKERTERNKQ